MTNPLHRDDIILCYSYSSSSHSGYKLMHIYALPFNDRARTLCGIKVTEYWGIEKHEYSPGDFDGCTNCMRIIGRMIEEEQYNATQEVALTKTRPHAVRWAIRATSEPWRDSGAIWTKWHWTKDADFTLCGRAIVMGREGVPLFPETDDEPGRVTCKICQRALQSIRSH